MMKIRTTREDLFEQDSYSVSWGEHQIWRIERLMRLESARLNIPVKSLRLAFQGRNLLELISRDGHRIVYRAEGIINHMHLPDNPVQTMTFEVSWIDPWGYFQQAHSSFFELRLRVMDELSFRRLQRLVLEAREAMRRGRP
jgi:hypothetical protein